MIECDLYYHLFGGILVNYFFYAAVNIGKHISLKIAVPDISYDFNYLTIHHFQKDRNRQQTHEWVFFFIEFTPHCCEYIVRA